MVDNTFIEITKENFKEFSFYSDFLKKCNRQEFLKSQIPFYSAVKSFPRVLCYLASLIYNGEDRLKIAENIWEEHGQGEVTHFHTYTFNQFLISINGKNYEFFSNPKVESWISSWFDKNNVYDVAINLAAIEYLYALISSEILEYCKNNKIVQKHYMKHSVIDWDHGKDLLDLALKYTNKNHEDVIDDFTSMQREFINVYKSMVVITEKDIQRIAKEPISFYYLREDSNITTSMVNMMDNIVVIGSGGESVMNIINSNKHTDILVVDMNPNQLQLIKDKLDNNPNKNFNTGKFEEIFKLLRNRFSKIDLCNRFYKDELRYALDDIFTNDNLSKIFGEDAVKYTEKSFSDHFYKVFTTLYLQEYDLKNFMDIFYGCGFSFPFYKLPENNNFNNISYMEAKIIDDSLIDDIKKKYKNQNISVFDLSNIGDWIPKENLINILKKIYDTNRHTNVIIRKLLGDYCLKTIMEEIGFLVSIDEDVFYEETIIGIKK